MKLWEALNEGKRLLTDVSDEPGVEAELLLRHVLQFDRGQLYGRLTEPLTPEFESSYWKLVRCRAAHEPTPYILGHKEFFGLDFVVTPAALIPRPETETLVELASAFTRERDAGESLTIADIGAGCGAIAISLAHALPDANVAAIDASPNALQLARRNAGRHQLRPRIRFLEGDLLDPLDQVDLLVANLPYIPTEVWKRLPLEIRDHEPRAALDGGADGLLVIKRFLQQAPDHLKPHGAAFAEIGDEQGEAVQALARCAFPVARVTVEHDLAGRDRALCVYT